MPLVSMAVLWSGYLLVFFGWSRLQSCTVTMTDLAIPGGSPACRKQAGSPAPGAVPLPNSAGGSATGCPSGYYFDSHAQACVPNGNRGQPGYDPASANSTVLA